MYTNVIKISWVNKPNQTQLAALALHFPLALSVSYSNYDRLQFELDSSSRRKNNKRDKFCELKRRGPKNDSEA